MPDSPPETLPLAAEFPPASHGQWRALVEAALKGRPFERLTSRTYDGIGIAPLHAPAQDAPPLPGRAPATPWQVLQRIDHPDPAAANAQALHDLENGATGLLLVFAGSAGSRGHGLPATAAAIERALQGVHLDGAAVELDLPLDSPPGGAEAARAVAALAERQEIAKAAGLRFGLDPLGTPALADLVAGLAGRGFEGPFAVADARPVHDAGGSEAQELAFALAVAVAFMRTLEQGGMAPGAARRFLSFRLAADADQLLTVAKFRAVRKLWARVEEACGLAPEPAFVGAETAWRMMARRDPYVNLLRTTVAAFSAGIAGADAVAVLPFTAALGLADGFARRLARNTQLILIEEAHAARVADPAAGAGAVEALTGELCRAAWTLFQEIEGFGGIGAALEHGALQQKVAATRAAREKAVATRRDPVTGVNEFPHLGELPATVLGAAAAPQPAPHGLAPMRLAAPFEQLRDAADRALAATGARPKIFLAALGRPAEFLARATFAKNFFEAGGIEAVEASGTAAGAGALAAAFKASGARLACLCSSDEVYAREAVVAAKTLRGAGAQHVYLAGRPGEQEAALREAGVTGFIHAGGDVLATLRQVHAILGLT